MTVDFRALGRGLGNEIRPRLLRRVRFALDRFSGRIRRVAVSITDCNGPRGGVDQVCRVRLALVSRGTIAAEATDADAGRAFDAAIDRVSRSVARQLERQRDRRGRVPMGGPVWS